ncbi:MAG: hypothetical protein FJ246_11715, partial [Nitrospira sp.]|nr:hypothetical protein [Nitrospira sp.]
MARYPNRDAIYHAAGVFRDRCLSGTGALNWSGTSPWTEGSLTYLWQAFVEHPDISKRTFFEKLKDQLAGANDDVLKVAVDILSFYYLYPDQMTAASKVTRLKEVAGWNGLTGSLDLATVQAAYATSGIGHPGTYYNTGLPWNFSFLIGLGRSLLGQPDTKFIASTLESVTTDVMAAVSSSSTALMRNVSMHLLLPDDFERIGTDSHKKRVLEAFPQYDPRVGSIDSRLRAVRTGLGKELGRPDFDFYEPMIKSRWAPAIEGDSSDSDPMRRVWIEKTLVSGRPDRMHGEHALGKALWSPQRSRGNADIYRTMREVELGDVVLHLTDNDGFTAVSEVAGQADDTFMGVPGTEWGNQPGYRIQLKNCQNLEPPLNRSVFFASPFKEQLLACLAETDAKLFYSSEPALNQGAYLTEAPPALVSILNAAYHSIANRDLLDGFDRVDISLPMPPPVVTAADFAAACQDFTSALQKCGLSFGSRHDDLVRS